jgi:protein-disulfide isomerase
MPKTAVLLMIAGLSAGAVGTIFAKRQPGRRQGASAAGAQASTAPGPRYRVPVGGAPSRGDEFAKVTIIEYSDYQCPFCAEVEATLSRIRNEYAGKGVRLVWKDSPLPFHDKAKMAAEAARAAGNQGRFWEMHDLLFQHQDALDRPALEAYAQGLNLDLQRFRATLDSEQYENTIESDIAEAQNFGARVTPSFFINGRALAGAQPFEAFKRLIDEELASAKDTYEETIANGLLVAAEPEAESEEPPGHAIFKAEVGHSPVRGENDAKVTIVVWSDFQCPFCSQLETTLEEIRKIYGSRVRIAWKNLPLAFHQNARPAAEAAMAACEQGKFWEMHDLLFANQNRLDRARLDRFAEQLHLDVRRFGAAMDSHQFKAAIDADIAAGARLGVRGTPTLFINGEIVMGAEPLEGLKSKIDRALVANQSYDEIMKNARADAADAPVDGSLSVEQRVYEVDARGPSRGPRSAPVTIIEFSDFQCPFCSRVEPTLDRIAKTYANKVRIVWKNHPLPFHDKATLAAEAALAADAQGRFWEMHDMLLANQHALDRASLERYARQIGLDLGRYRGALERGKFKNAIERDMKLAASIGDDMMTPTFFVNGRKIEGARPFESFKEVIDEELAKKHVAIQ